MLLSLLLTQAHFLSDCILPFLDKILSHAPESDRAWCSSAVLFNFLRWKDRYMEIDQGLGGRGTEHKSLSDALACVRADYPLGAFS